MRKILTIVFVLLMHQVKCKESIYFDYNNFSLFGGILHKQISYKPQFELLYERGRKINSYRNFSIGGPDGSSNIISSYNRARYFGVGINFSPLDSINEYGLKFQFSPIKQIIGHESSKAKFIPYLCLQGNLGKKNKELKTQDIYIRPGIGLTGSFFDKESIFLRSSFQIGYEIDNAFYSSNFFTYEIKIGISLNTRKLTKANKAIKNKAQNE